MSNAHTTTDANPKTGKFYRWPEDAGAYMRLFYRLNERTLPCEFGHDSCACWEAGPCSEEVVTMCSDKAQSRYHGRW